MMSQPHRSEHAVKPFHLDYKDLLYARELQGKVAELRLELNSGGGKKDKNYLTKRVALKKVVANMTMSNNDMILLFSDIIACMGIPNAEIKKMYDTLSAWARQPVSSDAQKT